MTGRTRKREVSVVRKSNGERLGTYRIPERDGSGNLINMGEAATTVGYRVAQMNGIPMTNIVVYYTRDVN